MLILYWKIQQKSHAAMCRFIIVKKCKKKCQYFIGKVCKNEFRHFFFKFMVRSDTAAGQNRAHVKREKRKNAK